MRNRLFRLILLLAFAWIFATPADAGVEQISEKEFRSLAEELAPKVNLFAEGWAVDPKAEFYGGTTRDYLYWLKGQFKDASSPSDAAAVINRLRALPAIDVRSFIIGDSDIDIISQTGGQLSPDEFGVRKIDFQSTDILDPTTEIGQNETLQGYIPAEKVRLGKDGLRASSLGDGVKEIYEGKLSVHFASPEDFARSMYAQEGINHPVLLALRYIRVQSINYFRTHGDGYPDPAKLKAGLDPESAKAVREILDRVIRSGELEPFLKESKFKSWLNGSIQKAFRSYTNPTAALELMKEFGVDQLPGRHPGQVETLNQYVFSKHHDPKEVAKSLKDLNVAPEKLYLPVSKAFPDGRIYHGTKNDSAFRSIVFQGVKASENGSAGGGLYGVSKANMAFAEDWGTKKENLVSLLVDPDAKIVDLTDGEGKRIWEALGFGVDDYDKFADLVGADILLYPYRTEAFVVKNGGVLHGAKGVHRELLSFSEILDRAKKLSTPAQVHQLLSETRLSNTEKNAVWRESKVKAADFAKEKWGKDGLGNPYDIFTLPHWREQPEILALLGKWVREDKPERFHVRTILGMIKDPSPDYARFVDEIFKDPKFELAIAEVSPFHEVLVDSGIQTPHAVAHAIAQFETKAKQHDMAFSGFLAQSTLSDNDAARILKVLRQSPTPEHFERNLVKALLRNKKLENEAIDFFKQRLYHSPLELKLQPIWLRVALEGNPEHPELKKITMDFVRDHFAKVTDTNAFSSTDAFAQIAEASPNNTELADFFLKQLESTGDIRAKAQQSLAKMNLDEERYSRLLSSNLHKQEQRILFRESVDKVPKHSKVVTRALLELYLHRNVIDLTEKQSILSRIFQHGVPSEALRLVEEIQRKALKAPKNDLDIQALAKTYWIYQNANPKDIPASLIDSSISLLETSAELLDDPGINKGQFYRSLVLEDQKIAARVQGLILKQNLGPPADELLHLSRRMPVLTKEYRNHLKKVAEHYSDDNRWKPVVDNLLQLVEDSKGCPEGFASMEGR